MRMFSTAFYSLAIACSALGQTYPIKSFADGGWRERVPALSGGAASGPVALGAPAGDIGGTTGSAYLITTIAGGAQPATSISGTSVTVPDPVGIATDPAGNLYFSSETLHSVFKLNTAGVLTRVAGSGIPGFSGDGGAATSATLQNPKGVVVDAAGNLYIADWYNCRIRKVTASNGMITTVAGSSMPGSLGDGGAATSAGLYSPNGVALDAAGNLYIADQFNSRIRKVTASNGTITTVAGNGTAGFSGDGGAATSAALNYPEGVALDAAGNLYIADQFNHRIRKVAASNGVITTVAGSGTANFSGEGGAATSAALSYPRGLAVDAVGNLYVADSNNYRIRKITASSGVITTVAGSGAPGFSGDGGTATSAALNLPQGAAVDTSGNLYVADTFNGRVRRVSAGIINTVVGGGRGDGSLGVFAQLTWLSGVARDNSGNLYLAAHHDHRVRKVAPNGLITTVAGIGTSGFSGDGGAATSAALNRPFGVAVDVAGNLYIADFGNSRVRKVTVSNGVITTVAGNGSWSYSGDGAAATSATLNGPEGVAVDTAGNLYIADEYNHRIRKVAAANGVITTVAGNGSAGFSGDGGAATSASLDYPYGVAVDPAGNLYIADYGNSRIRKVTLQTGVITTAAGNGDSNYSGDGGAATNAALGGPQGVAVDAAGNLYIADSWNSRIRKVAVQDGVITTAAGNGGSSYSGEGVAATSAAFFYPFGVTVDTAGNLYVADTENGRVRLLTPSGTSAVLTVTSTHSGAFAAGQSGSYTLTVANAASAGPTSGTVTVTEALPAALTLVSMSGPGWSCSAGSCTRSDSLSGGSSYPAITVTVNASSTAPEQVTNQASVSGGGAAITGAQDLTLITGASPGAGPGCSYTLAAGTPNPPSFTSAGGSGTATITAGAGCSWTAASSNPNWLTTTGAGSGNGTVNYTVAANTGATSRTGALAVAGLALNVTQAGTSPPTPVLPLVTAVSNASYQVGGAPDSLLAVFGNDLAKSLQMGTPSASGDLPPSIGGTSIEINGRAAPLVFVSPTQINCLVPGNTELGRAILNVKSEGSVIATGTVTISNTLPGLFSLGGTGSGPAAALNAVTYAPGPFPAQTPENPGDDKRTRIALFGTGIRYAGNSSHAPNTNVARNVAINATDASGKALSLAVEYAGPAPGLAGLDQVNVVIPAEANQDTTITVKLTAGTVSNAVTLALRRANGITVTPDDIDGFAIAGSQGQFTVGEDRKVYTVRNSASYAVTMRVRTPAWVTAVPAAAEIGGGSSITVTVATNSQINSLAAGPYFGTIDFTDGSVTTSRSVVLLVRAASTLPPTLPAGCEYAAAPTDQLFRALNTLSSNALVMWGTVHLASGGYGSVPFGFEMRPSECDVYGLPARGDYDIEVSRSGGGSQRLVVTFDTSPGFVISGRRVYTLRIAAGSCSAAGDAGISFAGQSVYSVCP